MIKNKKKICVVTGTRAEYGLLSLPMKFIKNDPSLELCTIVTGSHLSPEFNLTYKEIEKDGFIINKKIEMVLSADTPSAISKSVGFTLEALDTPALSIKLYDNKLTSCISVVVASSNHIGPAITALLASPPPAPSPGSGAAGTTGGVSSNSSASGCRDDVDCFACHSWV